MTSTVRLTTKAACRVARLDPQRLNEAIAEVERGEAENHQLLEP